MKRKILFILALLLMAVTGATAQEEQSETIATTDNVVEGTHFTISNDNGYVDDDGMLALYGITVTSKNGETITKVVITCNFYQEEVNDGNTSVSSGTKEITNGGGTITVTGVNATTFTYICTAENPQFEQFVVYYTETPATVPVTGVTLSPTTASLTAGGAVLELTPTVAPEGATDKTVKWSVEQHRGPLHRPGLHPGRRH